MRKLALVIAALPVLVAASFVSPVGALTASSGSPLPDPDPVRERSHSLQAPSARPPAAPSIPLSAAVTCDGGFNAVASPNGAGHNVLVSTSAVNANDVWAVGSWTNSSNYRQTLVEHFDGTSWSIFPTTSPGLLDNRLKSVVAISTNDVWMVGAYDTTVPPPGFAPNANAFAWHWDGSTLTGYVLQAVPGSLYTELEAVTATGPNDVWAVGAYWSAGYLPLIYHWNGAGWSPVFINGPSPTSNRLLAVSASSPTDVWAVGRTTPSGFTVAQSFAAHLSSTVWSTIPTANTTTGRNVIWGVNALEPNHAVGVGYGNFLSGSAPAQSQAWDLVTTGATSPITGLATGLGTGDNALYSVSRSGSILQAVGLRGGNFTLAIPGMWDAVGHTLAWGAPVPSASPSPVDNVLLSVVALSPYAFWATGTSYNPGSGSYQTLTELYCALRFSVTGAPPPTYVGAPFSLTVTAQNPNSTTASGYRGTVHFTSSDSQAVLPPDYMFTPGDAGTHVFTGVVLNSTGTLTITVADTVTSFVTSTITLNVSCLGACPGPGGTPGSRDANPGPAGTAGPRDTNQSGASTPGPRLPRLGSTAQNGDTPSGLALATAMGTAPTAGGAAPAASSTSLAAAPAVAAAPAQAQVAAIPVSEPAQVLIAARSDMMAASRTPAIENSPGYLQLVLIPLAIISMALLVIRRRKNRRLIGDTRP